MDGTRAVAITEIPSQLVSDDAFQQEYERIRDEIGVLPDTATATAAIAELAEG